MIYRGGKRLSKNELVGLDIVLTCGSIVRTGLSIEFSKCGLAEDILSEQKVVSFTFMARVSPQKLSDAESKARPACR